MPAESTTIRPKSVDEIQEAFTDWWDRYRHSRRLASDIRFSRPSRSENRLLMRSRLTNDVRLQLNKNELSCRLAGRKFYLVLDDFDVKAEVVGRMLCFEFKLSKVPARPLKEKLAIVEKTRHPIFFSRVLNALTRLENELPKEQIHAASAAPTDYMVLLEALTAPSVATQLTAEDPLAAARLRGVERQQALLKKSGGVLRGKEAAELLGISRQALDKRRRQGRLIALTQGRRGYAYPVWQFEGGKTLANLEKVLGRLRDHDPWMQLTFFLNANDRLDGNRPLDLLRSGKLEPILEAAASYGEQGAA